MDWRTANASPMYKWVSAWFRKKRFPSVSLTNTCAKVKKLIIKFVIIGSLSDIQSPQNDINYKSNWSQVAFMSFST